jgi:DNA replication protein DnaC
MNKLLKQELTEKHNKLVEEIEKAKGLDEDIFFEVYEKYTNFIERYKYYINNGYFKEESYDNCHINDIKKLDIDIKKSIYFHGPSRSGKTYAMRCIELDLWLHGKNPYCVKESDFIRQMRAADFKDRDRIIELIRTASILFLDDFGIYTNWTDFIIEAYFAIFDYRRERNLQTIISSNFQLTEFVKFITVENPEIINRILNRIDELCTEKYELYKFWWKK